MEIFNLLEKTNTARNVLSKKSRSADFGVKNSISPISTNIDPFLIFQERYSAGGEALNLSAVYAIIGMISNTFSKIPYWVINRKDKSHKEDDNLYKILNVQPNEKMNAAVFHRLMASWLLYHGEAYAIPVRGFRSTQVTGLYPIDPSRVSKVLDDDGTLYYRVTFDKKNNKTEVYRYDEIVDWKNWTLDGITGISPLEYARQTIQLGINQENFSKEFYEGGGRPSGILKFNSDLPEIGKKVVMNDEGEITTIEMPSKEIIREEWKARQSSGDRFNIAVLDEGVDYKEISQITPEQMEFVNSKELNVQDIARFFGMSTCMFKLGVGKQTYSSNEQGQICYINDVIVPILRQYELELAKILTESERQKGYVIKGNLNAELRGDTSARANWYDKMRSMGVYSINEIRELEDLPSIGEDGDTRLIGANSIPLERILEGATAGSATPNDLNPANEEQSEDEQQSEEENEQSADNNEQ